MTLAEIFRDPDSPHRLSLFTDTERAAVEATLWDKEGKAHFVCLATGKNRPAKPKEVVRQLWLHRLLFTYRYDPKHIRVEAEVPMGREKKSADIIVYDAEHPTSAYIIVEVKKPKLKDGKNQLKSYCNATGAPIGIWSNGDQYSYYHRRDPNYFNDLPEVPAVDQTLEEILNEKCTLEDLIKRDKLTTEHKSLKDLILEMEDEVLANAGVDVFEEVFKLIFTKLYDEFACRPGGKTRYAHLRIPQHRTPRQTQGATSRTSSTTRRTKWEGVFTGDERIKLTADAPPGLRRLARRTKALQLQPRSHGRSLRISHQQDRSKGEKGQYFTPRWVIDMCVKMLNPKEDETLIDTAAAPPGSPSTAFSRCGATSSPTRASKSPPLHRWKRSPSAARITCEEKVFAIDFDEKTVRVARCLNLIAGDGQTNVLHLNKLDWKRWDESREGAGLARRVSAKAGSACASLREKANDNRAFAFDVLMANPPFAGDIKQKRHALPLRPRRISSERTAATADSKPPSGRDLLFIERNLDYLRPGGRMAVVLPQGRFNNASDQRVREFIAERCRILGVVGLHQHTFKPHTEHQDQRPLRAKVERRPARPARSARA